MRRLFVLSLTFFGIHAAIFAQNSSNWSDPMHEVKYLDKHGKAANLRTDPGFQYADMNQEGQAIRFFFHKNIANISQARIVNQNTHELIARGKGRFFFGSAKMIFADGTVYKLQRSKNPNGYETIGPHGPLFKVENFGIVPVSTLNEKDFVTQTFFVFDRIRATQQAPADITYIQYPSSFNNQ